MVKFGMYAEYSNGNSVTVVKRSTTAARAEELCMNEIAWYSSKYGQCTYYTGLSGYDENLEGYWVDGEWFDDFDEENGVYVKNA